MRQQQHRQQRPAAQARGCRPGDGRNGEPGLPHPAARRPAHARHRPDARRARQGPRARHGYGPAGAGSAAARARLALAARYPYRAQCLAHERDAAAHRLHVVAAGDAKPSRPSARRGRTERPPPTRLSVRLVHRGCGLLGRTSRARRALAAGRGAAERLRRRQVDMRAAAGRDAAPVSLALPRVRSAAGPDRWVEHQRLLEPRRALCVYGQVGAKLARVARPRRHAAVDTCRPLWRRPVAGREPRAGPAPGCSGWGDSAVQGLDQEGEDVAACAGDGESHSEEWDG
ncbi:hypothetical protein V495_08056 [Pseudogymnoascus sp. VKM F-4514 (FW-929)]|nr:hypothetical protein V495_08056 [Pseudogymnoascus sp. VKM F-4514 (FW-929)]